MLRDIEKLIGAKIPTEGHVPDAPSGTDNGGGAKFDPGRGDKQKRKPRNRNRNRNASGRSGGGQGRPQQRSASS